MQRKNSTGGLSRRQFLKTTGAVVGVTAASAFLGGCGGTKTQESTGPLRLAGWDYYPALVEENLKRFEEMYGEQVDYQPIPGTYQTVLETKLIGGEHLDVMYIHTDQINRWTKADWVRTIDDMPDLAEIKKAIYPANLPALSNLEGNLVALPYYAGYSSMLYNEEKLAQAGLQPPTTWQEFMAQCQELKGKGICQYPFVPYWIATEYSTWMFFAMWYSEGEQVFDENYEPTFKDGGVAFKSVLEMMKSMYDQEFVPPDVLTMKDVAGVFKTGEHAFMLYTNYRQKEMNDPEKSPLVVGKIRNMLMPGKTRETMGWVEGYAMSPTAPEDRAWELMKFLGYKDKEGSFATAKTWVLNNGLGSSYAAVMEDPEVVASLSTWTDLATWNAQQEKARSRPVSQAFWYPEWNLFLVATVHDYLQGMTTIDETITLLNDKATELKAKYPG